MATYYGSTGNYPNNPEDYISVPNPDLVNPGPVTRFDTATLGTTADDSLTGTSGNDRLDGGGGNDLLYGGLGDDSYYVTVGDQVADDGGIDTIYFSGNGFWRLAPNIENIVAFGTGPTDFRGNNDANVMIGNDAENYFNGRAGDDTMIGLGGDDHFDMSTGRPGNAVGGLWTMGTRLIDGGTGIDTIDYDGYVRSAVTIDLGAGTASGGGDLGIGTATLVSIEDAVGGQYDDRITGSSAPNHLYGRGGNDVLIGGAGADVLDGGSGNDVLVGEASVTDLGLSGFGTGPITVVDGATIRDTLIGGEGDDFLDGGIGDDTMTGGTGDDSYVVSGADVVTELAGEGIDVVKTYFSYVLPANVENLTFVGSGNATGTGNALDNQIVGNAGRNALTGGAGNDTLDGGFDNDVLDGGAGVDVLFGNEGDDRIVLASAADLAAGESIDGGNGSDILFYTGTVAGTLKLTANVTGIETIQIAQVDGLGIYGTWGTTAINADASEMGGTSGVTLYGNDGDNTLTGTSYDDLFFAGAGNDVVVAGAGRDVISAGAGDDVLTGGDGDDALDGGVGNDSYYVQPGDTIFDAGGNDTVYASGSHELEADIENITATGSSATSFQGNNLTGVMTGNAANNYFNPRAGDDTLIGNAGNDYFDMSTGRTPTPGTRFVDGGDGIDTLDYDGYARSAVSIDMAAGMASGGGDLGVGSATFVSIERAVGGAFNDSITGSSGANELFGRGGNDSISGGAGNDTIWGGVGDDTISGGKGSDVLGGSYGNDTYLFGRADGTDTVRETDRQGDGWWFDNPTIGNSDTVQLGAGISADQVWLQRAGDNLVASIIGTSDQLVIENWYLGGDNRVEQFKTASGAVLLESQVQNLVDAMAAFAPPASGVTTLPAGYASTLDTVIAANWR